MRKGILSIKIRGMGSGIITRTGDAAAVAGGSSYLEGNLLEVPSLLMPKVPRSGKQRRWLAMDVVAVLCSMLRLSKEWEIRTSLRRIARPLGHSMGGRKLSKIREALTFLAENELEFESFLRAGQGERTSKGPAKIRILKQLEFTTPKGDRSNPVTVRIRLADEIMENLQGRYLKTIRLADYLEVRTLAGSKSHYAVPLWLYLEKKNKPEWKERAQLLHEKLDLGRYWAKRARAYVAQAADTLRAARRLESWSYVPGRDLYVFAASKT